MLGQSNDGFCKKDSLLFMSEEIFEISILPKGKVLFCCLLWIAEFRGQIFCNLQKLGQNYQPDPEEVTKILTVGGPMLEGSSGKRLVD